MYVKKNAMLLWMRLRPLQNPVILLPHDLVTSQQSNELKINLFKVLYIPLFFLKNNHIC